jgi:hypothetical protein
MTARRNFLRGAGGAMLALPLLDSFAAEADPIPVRMICIGNNMGFVPSRFFPTEAGADYAASPLLKHIAGHREDFTVFTNLDHGRNGNGGHGGVHAFLSGVLAKNAPGLKEANVTVDQKAAASVGSKTRYPSMQLCTEKGGERLSWATSGVAITPMHGLNTIFNALFQSIQPKDREMVAHRLDARRSMLDLVHTDANRLKTQVGVDDREKLDQYFTSVREVEKKLKQSKQWLDKEKPTTDYSIRQGADALDFVDRLPMYYDLVRLAVQTDSTRVLSMSIAGIGRNLGGLPITRGYHQLTHHGKVASYLEELSVIEAFQMKAFNDFLAGMKEVKEANGKTLLDNSMVLFGSGMGNASSHSNRCLPLILAGGGFKHGQHLRFAGHKDPHRTPATNLYLSMLQRFGLELDGFNLSSGTLTGLEVRG